MKFDRIIMRVHAFERMHDRGISMAEIEEVLKNGDVIESYPNDFPYPSELIAGQVGARQLHVVAALNPAENSAIVITVYRPDPSRWSADFKRRK